MISSLRSSSQTYVRSNPSWRQASPSCTVHSSLQSIGYRIASRSRITLPVVAQRLVILIFHMRNSNVECALYFISRTVHQAFLNAMKYRRWRSPVNGIIVTTVNVPGTYYVEARCEHSRTSTTARVLVGYGAFEPCVYHLRAWADRSCEYRS